MSLKPPTSCGGCSELVLSIHSNPLGVSLDPAGVQEGKSTFPPSPCSEDSALANEKHSKDGPKARAMPFVSAANSPVDPSGFPVAIISVSRY